MMCKFMRAVMLIFFFSATTHLQKITNREPRPPTPRTLSFTLEITINRWIGLPFRLLPRLVPSQRPRRSRTCTKYDLKIHCHIPISRRQTRNGKTDLKKTPCMYVRTANGARKPTVVYTSNTKHDGMTCLPTYRSIDRPIDQSTNRSPPLLPCPRNGPDTAEFVNSTPTWTSSRGS